MIQQLSTLLSYRVWAVERNFAERIAPILIHQMKSGRFAPEEERTKVASRYNGVESTQIGVHVPVRLVKARNGSNVAVIPVVGSLTKRGEVCSYGMRDYSNEMVALNKNADVAAIVLDIESPGGTVDGTPEFGLSVKGSKKPVVAFGDNMVASAAYWVASQAKLIIGNKNNPTEFGSIGTLYIHQNFSKYIEENIGSVEIIRAPQSVEKNRVNPIEPLSDDQRLVIQDDLKMITKDFITAVKKGRGSRLNITAEGMFAGRMFKASEALENGMIDSIGTLADAIDEAARLAVSKNVNSNQTNKMSITKKVSSFFQRNKKAADDSADDSTPAWTEDMVFNTDGSGDGAFCLHPDSDGNNRKFETKIDNNQGNEPPTDPAITEDDFWSVVSDAGTSTSEAHASQPSTVSKLNAALKISEGQVKKLIEQNNTLQSSVNDLKAKLDKKPAGAATTVVSQSDTGHEYGNKRAVRSWEKKAAARFANKKQ